MDISRWTRKIRREVKANPKKAALLALLTVVAMYYWTPLLWGWRRGRSSADDMLAQANEPSAFAPATRGSAASPSPGPAAAKPSVPGRAAAPSHPWQEIVRWMEQDPRMKPAETLLTRRDPFHAVAGEVAATDVEEESEEAKASKAAAAKAPADLGAELTSTFIGPQRRLALINGRPYQQGRTIALGKDGQQVEFRLSEVHPRRIVLERDGQRYELAIPQPAPAGRLEMSGGTTN